MGFPTAADVVTNLDDLKGLFGLNPSLIGDIDVDLVISYSDPFSADITERPVEAGFDVTDARVIRPQFLTMECVFCDPDFSGQNIAKKALQGVLGQSLFTSWRDKRDRLDEIKQNKEVISVSTPSKTYDSMLIADIRPDVRASTANAFFFTIDFKQVRIVSSEVSLIDEALIPKDIREKESLADKQDPAAATKRANAKKRRQPEQNRGKVQGETATTKKADTQQTWLSALTGVGG